MTAPIASIHRLDRRTIDPKDQFDRARADMVRALRAWIASGEATAQDLEQEIDGTANQMRSIATLGERDV